MTVTYCTSADVAAMMGLSADFSTSTKPTKVQVEALINQKEKRINQRTGHAWMTVSEPLEYLNTDDKEYDIGRGMRFNLKHRKLATFSYAAGDRLDYWDGTAWNELFKSGDSLDSSVTIDTEFGIVWIRNYSLTGIRKARYRIIYRYGDSSVPEDIKEACVKMVVLDLASNPFYNALPQGVDRFPLGSLVQSFKDDIDEILSNRTEVVLIV